MSNNIIKRNMTCGVSNKPFIYTESDFDKCGWLKKQGGTFKTMKRRYCVLVKDVLYYFTTETKSILKGQINLRNLELSDLEEDRGNGEYIFNILPAIGKDSVNRTHEKFQLICNDKNEAESWLQHIKQNIYLRRGGGLYGTSLNTVRKYLKQEYDYVPKVVFECCQRIREIAMDEEGIFRKNGQQSLVHHMKSNLDRAQYNWNDADIHTTCSLLKLYLRELPEPLIPFKDFDSLKAVGYRIQVGEDLDFVRNKLRLLPPPNLQLLKYLCEFLFEVSTHPKNRMEIDSLAKVFSPNILRNRDTDLYIEESSSSLISITVAAFIKSHHELFQFEYEPITNDDDDYVNEDDRYSVYSAFSNMSFAAACLNFDDSNGSTSSLPHQCEKEQRNKSMIFTKPQSFDNLKQLSSYSQSIDHMEQLAPRNSKNEYDELVELACQDSMDHISQGKSMNVCEKCQQLKSDLELVTEERDAWQRLCDIKKETCRQLQKDIEVLRAQLSEKVKSNDLSEVLAYFKMNR